MKAQMRSANRAGAKFALIVGSEERAQNKVKVKPMGGGDERLVPLDEVVRILKGETP